MKRFVEGIDRGQSTLFPECLEDWIDEDNPVHHSNDGIVSKPENQRALPTSATLWRRSPDVSTQPRPKAEFRRPGRRGILRVSDRTASPESPSAALAGPDEARIRSDSVVQA